MKKNKFDTLKKNIESLNAERTLGFLEKCNEEELLDVFHQIKRNQLFNIKYPSDFEKKLNFIKELNLKISDSNIIDELKIYFEFIEELQISMKSFYDFFNTNQSNFKSHFLIQILMIFEEGMKECQIKIEENRESYSKNGYVDFNLPIAIKNKDIHQTDIDGMYEMLSRFLVSNINYYKFKKSIKDIQIVPDNVDENDIIESINETNYDAIIKSFNAWENGIGLIDYVNLFDWDINKSIIDGKKNFLISPSALRLNEYINNHVGTYIDTNLKFGNRYMEYLTYINTLKYKNESLLLSIEYDYIKYIFEEQYYIDSKFFEESHNGIKLEAYIKFYLLIRNHYFHINREKSEDVFFFVKKDFLFKLFKSNMENFKSLSKLKNKKDDEDVFSKLLHFFINNGDDLYNYPIIKYSNENYLIPNTIQSANHPRIFFERFLELYSDNKYVSGKGSKMEKELLPSNDILTNSGLTVISNIELKDKGNKNLFGKIDLLLFDGKNIIIAELKNLSLYNSKSEHYNKKKYLKKVAVKQLEKAKVFLEKNKVQMSNELKIDLNNIKEIIPIIVTSLEQLNNTVIDGILVVGVTYLKTYLSTDHIALREVSIRENRIKEKFYFRKKIINLKEFINFINSNEIIELMGFFNTRKINNSIVIDTEKTSFSRTILSFTS